MARLCFLVAGFLSCACAWVACGGRTTDSSSSPIPSETDASSNGSQTESVIDAAFPIAPQDAIAEAAGRRSRGRCSTNADCPGGTCVELVPGGFRVCSTPPVAPQPCSDAGSSLDQCCGSCAAGTCTLVF